ncbi:MAG TPA: protein kinase, partial [Gemmata sp.]|nr:protein kinase [Gemmata sp.]
MSESGRPTYSFDGSDRQPVTGSFHESEVELSVEQALLLDEACNTFESKWRAGGRPDIWEAALELPESVLPVAFRELIQLDVYYRQKLGEAPSGTDYSGRFPDIDPEWLALLVAKGEPQISSETEAHGTCAAEKVGSVIAGKYMLVEEIGEGGMGSVFLARQTEPVMRAVAVKVIKAGMDSRAVLARFEAERQALAMMDHPNIAKVLDAGTTASGRPFFVMELVKGVPITKYCDDLKLTPRQRLELFIPVCQALQHAHQKGIIHRDIKPNNVLVALYDDNPIPKVIDFGLAKATGQTLTDKTLMTEFGVVIGTPEYMSPEQASLNNPNIDTRSDIYSLGVLLYELLTGTTPVDRKSLGKAAILEILRIVREVEAPRPSDKLSTTNTRSVAASRGTDPAWLSKMMRGELDWVVLKALEKDRTRRYDTANDLARDLQRYLADEVVEARPPSTLYRLRKFLKRKRGPLLTASFLIVTLAAGILGTTLAVQFLRQPPDLGASKDTPETTLRNGFEHARQLDVALLAWERHDVAEAERVLSEVEPAFEQTWEQRHLRELCRKVRRLDVLGGNEPNGGAVMAVSNDGLLFALAALNASFKAAKPAAANWEVRVYELATGRERLIIPIRTSVSSLTSMAFSPDCRRIVLGASLPVGDIDPTTGDIRFGTRRGFQGFAEVFDVATGQRLHSLRGKHWDELDTIHNLSFSPDSRRIVARTKDGAVSVWDADSGREEFSLQGPTSKVIRLRFSPDGRWIATLHANGGLWIWDGTTGEQKFLLKQMEHVPPWDIIAFSPDGRHLAVSRFGDLVHVFDVETGLKKITFAVHQTQSLAFSPDGESIAVADGHQRVRVFEAATGREKESRMEHKRPVCGVVFSGDGKRLASSDWGGSVKVWDQATGAELSSNPGPDGAWFKLLAFSPDNRRLAFCVSGGPSPVNVWNLDTDKVDKLKGILNNGNLGSLAFSPDGMCISAVQADETVIEWNAATGRVQSTLHVPVSAIALVYLATGPHVTARNADGSVYVQDASSGKRTIVLKNRVVSPISSVAFSPDSKRIATRNGDQTVKVWNLATGREMFTLPGPLGEVSRESFTPDGIRIALVSDGIGKVFDATEGRTEWQLQGGGRANDKTDARELATISSGASRLTRLTYSPDGSLVALREGGLMEILGPFGVGAPAGIIKDNMDIVDVQLSSDGVRVALVTGKKQGGQRVRLWDRGFVHNERVLEFPDETVVGVFFTANTAHVLTYRTVSPDGLRVWDETGQSRLTLQFQSCGTAISPDGRHIAAGGHENTVGMWNALTGEKKLALELPTGDPLPWLGIQGFRGRVQVCFSPDSRRLVTATPEPTIRVRDAETGKEVLALRGHKHMVLNVFWSLDVQRIVSNSMDGTIRVWDALSGQELRCWSFYQGGGRAPDLLALSPDGGSLIAYASEATPVMLENVPAVLDVATGKVKLTLKGRAGKV